jgi:DNA-binding transcriptional ArsR family regulator
MLDVHDAVFAALADPTRRRVLQLVAERGPTSATVLEHELPVTRQAIVKHLVVLSRAGLVTGHRTGQEVRYALVPEPLDEVSTWIAEIGVRWDERLARLRQLVLESEPESESESGVGV